jgi:hypothetical protein
MSAAEVLAPEISEPLTWVEICTRYPDEWVCLVEMDRVHPFGFEFRSARVVGHGKTRRAPVDQAMRWRSHYDSIGHYFTGRIDVPSLRSRLVLDDET